MYLILIYSDSLFQEDKLHIYLCSCWIWWCLTFYHWLIHQLGNLLGDLGISMRISIEIHAKWCFVWPFFYWLWLFVLSVLLLFLCDCFDDDSSSILLLPSMVRIEPDIYIYIFGQSWMRSSWMGNLPITYVTRMGRLKQNTPRTGWGYSDTPTSRGSVLLMEVSWSIMKSWTATRFGH